jgi:hypothetical protein
LVVVKEDASADAQAGKLGECSCGYDTDVVFEAGTTPEGEHYDAKQTNIVYNHVALLPPGAGRQGAKSSLRLDSAGNEISIDEQEKGAPIMKLRFRIDSKTVVEADAGTPQAGEYQAKQDAYIAGLESANATLTGERDREKGRADAAEKTAENLKAELAAAPGKLTQAIKDRASLEAKAVSILGSEFKCDGQTDRAIMVAVIRKNDSAFVDSDKVSIDYIRGQYEALSRSVTQRDSLATNLEAPKPDDGSDPDKARTDALKTANEAWSKPIPGALTK